MKRLVTSLAAAAMLAAAAVSPLQAQEGAAPRRASRFDLGLYGGGSYTTDWFTTPGPGGGQVGWAPGFSGIFGGVAQYWLTPSLGLRLHGAYAPEEFPQSDVYDAPGGVANSYFYDLDLVFRPFFSYSRGGFFPSVYLFVGGGGYTADVSDDIYGVDEDDVIVCYPLAILLANGVCVANHPEYSTTGMGVAGLGADFFRLTSRIGIFGEVAVHGYDSPAHVAEGGGGEDKFTFTPRAVLGLKAAFGDIPGPLALVPPPPPPPTEVVVTPPPAPLPPPQPSTQEIQVCVVRDGALTNVTVAYDPATGDTTANGQPFATAFPAGAQYAAGATWFVNREPVRFQNRRFVRFDLPRVLGVNEVTQVGDFQGVPIFAEAGLTRPEVIYLPVRPGCEFQPYQVETKAGNVRGE